MTYYSTLVNVTSFFVVGNNDFSYTLVNLNWFSYEDMMTFSSILAELVMRFIPFL